MESNPEGTSSDRPVALIGAVDNVLRMLRLFEDHEMIRVNQVARDLGLSRSTVHRMLATLSHHRYVEQDAQSRAYKPGPALVDIGLGVVSKIDIRAKARSALLRLRDLTQETAHLGTMRGPDSVIFLDSIESERIVRTGSRIGRILPAHATATGKVLLAELADADVAALYSAGVPGMATSRALTSVEELLEELAEVRRLGYGVNHGESEEDVAAVAAAVRDKRGAARFALVVTAPASRADEAWAKTAAAAVMTVARELGDQVV